MAHLVVLMTAGLAVGLRPTMRLERPQQAPGCSRARALRQLSSGAALAAAAAVAAPRGARAAYGPASGAVTSAPPFREFSLDDLEKLGQNPKKLRQVLKGQRGGGLDALLLDIEKRSADAARLVEELQRDNSAKKEPQTLIDALVEKERAALRELESKRELQAQIKNRARRLAKLEAQPEWFNYAAALAGSCVSTLVMHPVDTLKIRLIASESAAGGAESAAAAAAPPVDNVSAQRARKPPLSALAQLLDLYEGIVGNLVKEGPSSALYLGVYEAAKNRLSAPGSPLASYTIAVYLVAGAAGELCGSVFRAPAEAVKCRVQSRAEPDAASAARAVLGSADGRANVVRAWAASLWRDVPMGAVQIAIFEGLKLAILNAPGISLDVESRAAEAALGAIGGAIGALVTTPPDVITTRIITQAESGGDDALGFAEMARTVLDEGGPAAFFVGWKERILYWTPAISLFLTCYCTVRQTAAESGLF